MSGRRARVALPPETRDAPAFWSSIIVGLLAIGVLIRIALYFPLAMFQIDSDAVIAGLCAFRIADGQYPAFLPGGTRVGAASCYVASAYFHLFGIGRVGLALTGLTWGALFLVFMLLFLRATLDRKTACLAFLFAIVPSEQFMTVTYAPWGYGEIVASCAATLWLAALWRNEGALWQRLCFGLSVGLGVWFSLQTLMISIPAIAWISLRRRRSMLRETAPAVLGAIVGAAAFLAANVAHGFPTLTQNWASRPAASVPQVADNFVWLSTFLLPKLLFRDVSGLWSQSTILIAAYALATIGFIQALRNDARDRTNGCDLRAIGWLLALTLASCLLVFSFSEAGTIRGWTVRYIAPLYIVVPLFLGVGVERVSHWSRWLAAVLVAALLIPNVLAYGLPGSALRASLTTQLSNAARLRDALTEHRVRMVYGNYDWVYDLNFDSHEGVAGVPFYAPVDYYNYAGRLGTAPARWALLGGLGEVSGWARALDARGAMRKDGDLYVFIANRPAPNAAQLLATLRSLSRGRTHRPARNGAAEARR